jgi:class 3 adenylate cyclase
MDDVRAVMDAVGSNQAAIKGIYEGGAMAMLFAATYPERTRALVLCGCYAHFPTWAPLAGGLDAFLAKLDDVWGTGATIKNFAPDGANDPQTCDWWARWERSSASPSAVATLMRMNSQIDVRPVLPAIQVPTLVVQRAGDSRLKPGAGRYVASQIPNARYVEVPGINHAPWIGDIDAIVDEIEEFLTGTRPVPELNRVLMTLMFTDVVDSTKRAADLGDRRWVQMIGEHDRVVRQELARYRGREVKTLGDGFLATFDGPARGVRCAKAITEAVKPLGIEVRSGVHTGEVEIRGEDISGIAVNVAARISGLAKGGQVLVSSTVRDLVVGSELVLHDHGLHAVKGLSMTCGCSACEDLVPSRCDKL